MSSSSNKALAGELQNRFSPVERPSNLENGTSSRSATSSRATRAPSRAAIMQAMGSKSSSRRTSRSSTDRGSSHSQMREARLPVNLQPQSSHIHSSNSHSSNSHSSNSHTEPAPTKSDRAAVGSLPDSFGNQPSQFDTQSSNPSPSVTKSSISSQNTESRRKQDQCQSRHEPQRRQTTKKQYPANTQKGRPLWKLWAVLGALRDVAEVVAGVFCQFWKILMRLARMWIMQLIGGLILAIFALVYTLEALCNTSPTICPVLSALVVKSLALFHLPITSYAGSSAAPETTRAHLTHTTREYDAPRVTVDWNPPVPTNVVEQVADSLAYQISSLEEVHLQTLNPKPSWYIPVVEQLRDALVFRVDIEKQLAHKVSQARQALVLAAVAIRGDRVIAHDTSPEHNDKDKFINKVWRGLLWIARHLTWLDPEPTRATIIQTHLKIVTKALREASDAVFDAQRCLAGSLMCSILSSDESQSPLAESSIKNALKQIESLKENLKQATKHERSPEHVAWLKSLLAGCIVNLSSFERDDEETRNWGQSLQRLGAGIAEDITSMELVVEHASVSRDGSFSQIPVTQQDLGPAVAVELERMILGKAEKWVARLDESFFDVKYSSR